MQIEIPDSPELRSRAKAAGFEDVETYVRSVVEASVTQAPVIRRPANADLDPEERNRRFREFLDRHAVRGVKYVDDSRESIYEDRGL